MTAPSNQPPPWLAAARTAPDPAVARHEALIEDLAAEAEALLATLQPTTEHHFGAQRAHVAHHAPQSSDKVDTTPADPPGPTPLGGADDPRWVAPTPSPGWTVRDQLTHLAHFDDRTVQALVDPDAFNAHLEAERHDLDGMVERVIVADRRLDGPAALAELRRARADLLHALRAVGPAHRMPWYGPPMSASSAATARVMETWAHGVDVTDALGLPPIASSRLRHVAFLGFRTIGFSFVVNDRPVPEAAVRLELTAPDGTRWDFGPDDATDRVTGSALDLCLLVTQRRHRADTDLTATGAVADAWLDIAQAFAGPPGGGRAPAGREATGGAPADGAP